MLLSKLHLRELAHVDGSTQTMFTTEQGWTIALKPELGGVLVTRAGGPDSRLNAPRETSVWIPFSNCRNGYPLAEASQPGKK
jgi:hypothetical protein